MRAKPIALTLFVALLTGLPTGWQTIPSPIASLPAIAQTVGDRLAEAQRLEQQGEEQLDRQQASQAVQSFQQARKLYQELQRGDRVAAVETELGKALLLAGQPEQAIPLLQQTVNRAQFGRESALSNLGLAWFLTGNLTASEAALKEAIAGWESIRASGSNTDLDKITLFEQQAHTYRLLQKVLVAQHRSDAALEVAEQSRSRALVEQLVQRYSPSSPRPDTLTLSQIQQVAQAQTATIVEYSIVGREMRVVGNEPQDESDLLIWVVQPSGKITFRQVHLSSLGIQSLAKLVLKTREMAIGARGRGVGIVARTNDRGAVPGAKTELKQLHQVLIQPIADLLPSDPQSPVVVMPQGSLFLVPFAALADAKGKYLIEKHTLLVAPSIQVFALSEQDHQARNGDLFRNSLIVGNPTMPSLPVPAGQPSEPLPALPGAEKEARSIATFLKVPVLLGNQATKQAVLQRLTGSSLIHLATHGLLDLDANLNEFGQPLQPVVRTARESRVRVNPGAVVIGKGVIVGGVSAETALAQEKVVRVEMPGAIALAPSQGDNGFLSAKAIAGMRLKADLVVLSACDTGRGRITGDGVVGLSRAFMAAGVPSVVVSLWSVPDAPTASLMTTFYQALQQSPNKAQALRKAMITTLKQYPDPLDWAAFTLVGAE